MINKHKWLIAQNYKDESTYEIFFSSSTEIHNASEEFARYRDSNDWHYPGDRDFYIWCPRRGKWLVMNVFATIERHYDARHTGEIETYKPKEEFIEGLK